MKMLILLHDFPYPPFHGGRYDMFYRLKSLYEIGLELDVIITVNKDQYPSESEISLLKKFTNNLIILERRKNLKSFLTLLPFQVSSRFDDGINNYFLEKNTYYDYILLEDFFMWEIFKFLNDNKYLKKPKKVFIRLHNDNYKYFIELSRASSNIFKKLFFLQEAIKFRFYVENILKNNPYLHLLPISYDDFKILKNKYNHVFWLPPALDLNKIKPYKEKKENILLFIGNLFTPNNIEGIVWFIKKVNPILQKKIDNYKLIIAGKTKGRNPIKKIISTERNIYFFDSPSSNMLEEIYDKAKIFVNPVLKGAGVKIKNIDALLHGIPVITTRKGNEGTGLINKKHIFVADDPYQFVETITLLINNESLSEYLVSNGQNFLMREYNHLEKLKQILEIDSYENCHCS